MEINIALNAYLDFQPVAGLDEMLMHSIQAARLAGCR